jgi:hypothetical protein
MLQDIKRDLLSKKLTLVEAITHALPELKSKLAEDKLAPLIADYFGQRSIAMDWYLRPSKEHLAHRVVPGAVKMLENDGSLANIRHRFAEHDRYFIAAPIVWLEKSLAEGGDLAFIEMTEMGGSATGKVVCVTEKSNIERIVDTVKQNLLALIDEAEPT